MIDGRISSTRHAQKRNGGVKCSLRRFAFLTPPALSVVRKWWVTDRGNASRTLRGSPPYIGEAKQGVENQRHKKLRIQRAGQIRYTTKFDIERDSSDRRVQLTATRTFAQAPRRICASDTRQSNRLQQLVSSDTNVHRTPKMVHQECEWKRGEQVVFSKQTGVYLPSWAPRHMIVCARARLAEQPRSILLSLEGPPAGAVRLREPLFPASGSRGCSEVVIDPTPRTQSLKKPFHSRDGPLNSAVNGRSEKMSFSVDKEGPSHGSPRSFQETSRVSYASFG
jgi:hypothetical protein